jgi:hypothetical protein
MENEAEKNKEIQARDLFLFWFLYQLDEKGFLFEMSVNERMDLIKEFTGIEMISQLIMVYKDKK